MKKALFVILMCLPLLCTMGFVEKSERVLDGPKLIQEIPLADSVNDISSSSTTLNTKSLKVEDITSMQVVGMLRKRKDSRLYQNTEEKGKTTIRKIIRWINTSKPVGVQTNYGKHGYPMVIILEKNDGTLITVEPAYKCVFEGHGVGFKTCTYVKGEIVLWNGSNNIRAESPELYDWLIQDWKKEK